MAALAAVVALSVAMVDIGTFVMKFQIERGQERHSQEEKEGEREKEGEVMRRRRRRRRNEEEEEGSCAEIWV